MKNTVFHKHSVSRSIVVKKPWFPEQNCDFEGLEEEKEQTTDTPTHRTVCVVVCCVVLCVVLCCVVVWCGVVVVWCDVVWCGVV